MRVGIWCMFGLLVACESAEPSSGSSESAGANASALKVPGRASPSALTGGSESEPPTAPPVEPVRRVDQVDPLPAISKGFSQALKIERGRCWVTLERLAPSALDRTRAEFEARNPGARAQSVDPFTGRLKRVIYPRDKGADGPRVELSDEALLSRTLSPLRRNADLFGLTAADLELLEWEPKYVDRKRELVTASGAIPCRAEAARLGSGVNPCWRVVVDLRYDGVVSSVRVERFGPPVPMCTTPLVDKATVRAASGVNEASPSPIERDQSLPRRRGRKLAPQKPVEQPSLTIERSFGDQQAEFDAPSVTWRLVWSARFVSDLNLKTFVVDAVSGKRLRDEEEPLITNCFPRRD